MISAILKSGLKLCRPVMKKGSKLFLPASKSYVMANMCLKTGMAYPEVELFLKSYSQLDKTVEATIALGLKALRNSSIFFKS